VRKDVIPAASRGRAACSRAGAAVCTTVLLALLAGCAGGPAAQPAAPADRSVKFTFSNAEGHFFRGNLLEAVAAYSEVIAADPKNAPAFRGRAAALAVLGRDAEALADYGRAVELDPRFDDAWLGRGLYLFSRGRFAEAIDDFDRVAALDPNSAIAHKYRALACDKVGRLREAAASRQAYIHCVVPHEHPESGEDSPPARELKALGLEE
jgi:tetratricopeptide (TPR) repeat protein